MDELMDLVKKFNERAERDESLRNNLKNLKRNIVVKFSDDGEYYLKLDKAKVEMLSDPFTKADITVELSTETFKKLLNKEIDALSAYITRKIVVKASLSDKLLISELLK